MYPQGELNRLAAYKLTLRGDIARRRRQCAQDAASVLRPLRWADAVATFCRKLRPFAGLAVMPVAATLVRVIFPGRRLLGLFVRWSPLLVGAFSMLGRKRRAS
jgi:hypothetical protein